MKQTILVIIAIIVVIFIFFVVFSAGKAEDETTRMNTTAQVNSEQARADANAAEIIDNLHHKKQTNEEQAKQQLQQTK